MRVVFEYAIVRVVPHVEREEFVNVGVAYFCEARAQLHLRLALDEQRLKTLAPNVDVDEIRRHLEAFEQVCRGGEQAGPIGELSPRERWRWLVAPRSTTIQTSAAHAALSDDLEGFTDRVLDRVVRPLR